MCASECFGHTRVMQGLEHRSEVHFRAIVGQGACRRLDNSREEEKYICAYKRAIVQA